MPVRYMIQIDLITKDDKKYQFGSVNQKDIHKNIKQAVVKKDGTEVFNIKLERDERILVRKRTNQAEGNLYVVGFHKKEKQKLFFINEDGKVIDHEKDCKCEHTFHGNIEIDEHEK